MKASALLKEQHDEVKLMFKQLEKGNGRSSAVLAKLADSLAAHMAIEQELFYPAVLIVKEDLVLEGYEEHAIARFALKRLMKTAPSDRTFKAKLTTLKEIIEDHMKEEESELFPRAEKALGDSSEGLCRQMKVLFAETAKTGYERTVGRGGPTVTSATAPLTNHP
jgi:iron-sulfur cluster repair protein YtfE (RIC family)